MFSDILFVVWAWEMDMNYNFITKEGLHTLKNFWSHDEQVLIKWISLPNDTIWGGKKGKRKKGFSLTWVITSFSSNGFMIMGSGPPNEDDIIELVVVIVQLKYCNRTRNIYI